jgi:hypothetical protein
VRIDEETARGVECKFFIYNEKGAHMAYPSFLQYVLLAYVVLALIKTVLCWSSVHTAAVTYCTFVGRERMGMIPFLLAAMVPFAVFFSVLPLLARERLHFFRCYTSSEVKKEVVDGLCN